ncbi:MAG: FdtA/QdtA family cupin domain-containing protein [Dysgonamonadaceae bacterium]|jgi:dTDP-4-dehydrorhamnose 3,5-epimerase-like enzyme|nr:FdtA/QdtA family cupin domain-containing protein [Dysgonamonadaceae bacterium]
MISNCNIITLPKIHNRSGNITALNNGVDLPFDVRRVYYLYDIPGGESRGGHAHKALQQLIVAVSGSFDVTLDDGTDQKTCSLNRPYYGLYVVPGIWRELSNFSSGAVCLVLASAEYDEKDYIRKYDDFVAYRKDILNNKLPEKQP